MPISETLKWSYSTFSYRPINYFGNYEYDILLLACYYNNTSLINTYLSLEYGWKNDLVIQNLIFKNDNLEVVLKNQNLGMNKMDMANIALTHKSRRIFEFVCSLLTAMEKKDLIQQSINQLNMPNFKFLLNSNNFTKSICQQKCKSGYFRNEVLIITDIIFRTKGTLLSYILQKKVPMTYNQMNNKFKIIIPQNDISLKYIQSYKFSKGRYKDCGIVPLY